MDRSNVHVARAIKRFLHIHQRFMWQLSNKFLKKHQIQRERET